MTIKTINPYTEKEIGRYEEDSISTVKDKISGIRQAQLEWKKSIHERIDFLGNVVNKNLRDRKKEIAKSITDEMGKPISQSIAEVEKCIDTIDYICQHYSGYLDSMPVETSTGKAYIRFDPIGVVLLIMPWNFPLWQVVRAAVPAMIAGNGIVLKHASSVTGTSKIIEEVFETDVFKSIVLKGNKSLSVIQYVDGVSFTGSTNAGSLIASEAGQKIKKSVLELGGSDPFIVLASADIDRAVKNATIGRLQNGGQSCIASKRFIVDSRIEKEFGKKLEESFANITPGDPEDNSTFLGPLSSSDQSDIVTEQVSTLKSMGKVIGGGRTGNLIEPTIAYPGKLFYNEIFGPVAVIKPYKTDKEAIDLANDSPYGLGASIWGNPEDAEKLASEIQSGMVYVNKLVASDPRVPFGGTKNSGYGRELSQFGIREFTNIKTVWIEK